MADPQSLQASIREKLKAADEQVEEQRRGLAREMEQREQRQRRFAEILAQLVPEVVEPRVAQVVETFPHATLQPLDGGIGRHWVWTFAHVPRYPASVELTIGIEHDDRVENLLLQYTLEILPIFFQFERHHQLALPLDAVDDEAVAAWIDERILEFVDTYLRIGQTEQYQKEVVVTDPVCGMQITPHLAIGQEQFAGRTWYFCAESCRQKFREEPERYVPAGVTARQSAGGVKSKEAALQAQTARDQQALDQLDDDLHDLRRRIDKQQGGK